MNSRCVKQLSSHVDGISYLNAKKLYWSSIVYEVIWKKGNLLLYIILEINYKSLISFVIEM